MPIQRRHEPYLCQGFMGEIDSKWARMITYYALKHGVSLVCPFFTGKFVRYTDDPTAWNEALLKGNRTPPFYEYQKLASEFQR